MKIVDIQMRLKLVNWHDKRNALDVKLMMLTKNINQTFTHIPVDAALDGVIDRGDSTFNLKKDVKEPF